MPYARHSCSSSRTAMDHENERTAKEAAEWLQRLNSRAVSSEELQEFYEWRRTPGNAAAYSDIERVWAAAKRLERDPDIGAVVGEALRPRKALAKFRIGRREVLAASLVGALALGGVLLNQRSEVYETKVSEQRSVALADGSRMLLNTDSQAAVSYSRSTRAVELARGEAIFEVTHDVERPFVVTVGGNTVTVLGTKFGVRKTDEDVRIVLVQGSLKVGSGSVSTTLVPGQAIEIDRNGRGTIRRVAAAEALAWAEGRLVFRRTRVADAIKEVNRYARLPIELRHPGLGEEEVSGTFSTGDSDAFAVSLVTLFELQRDGLEEDRIVLTK